MTLDATFNFLIIYVLAFFRLAGLMLMAPFFGSTRVPRRVKLLFALIATVGMASVLPRSVELAPTWGTVAFHVAGEMIFGLAMGSIVSFTFIAAQWAGEMIGQQIGFNLSEVFDPQFGQAGSLVGDIYFFMTLMVFLMINGHHILLRAVFESFKSVPLMSLGFNADLFDVFTQLFTTATTLAMRLAAPMFFTMLVVDLAMGCIGKAMPQFNIMSAGLPIRSLLGIAVLIGSMGMTSDAIQAALLADLRLVTEYFSTGSLKPNG